MSEWWDDPRDIRIRHRHEWLWEECGATLTGVTPLGRHVDLRCVATRHRHVHHRDANGVLFRLDAHDLRVSRAHDSWVSRGV